MEIKKISLQQCDDILCTLYKAGQKIQQLDLFYRKTRTDKLQPIDSYLESKFSEERCIPKRMLEEFATNPIGMFQLKYTGANNLYARIIVDGERSLPERRRENSNWKKKGFNRENRGRMRYITKNIRTDNNVERVTVKKQLITLDGEEPIIQATDINSTPNQNEKEKSYDTI